MYRFDLGGHLFEAHLYLKLHQRQCERRATQLFDASKVKTEIEGELFVVVIDVI